MGSVFLKIKSRALMCRIVSLPIFSIPKMVFHNLSVRRAFSTICKGLNVKWSRFHGPFKIVASMALKRPFVKLGKVFTLTVLSSALLPDIPKILVMLDFQILRWICSLKNLHRLLGIECPGAIDPNNGRSVRTQASAESLRCRHSSVTGI